MKTKSSNAAQQNKDNKNIIDENDLQDTRVFIDRSAFNKKKFDDYTPSNEYPNFQVKGYIKNKIKNDLKCDKTACKKQIYNRLPAIRWIKNYNFKEFFLHDLLAGLTVGTMHIPYGRYQLKNTGKSRLSNF